MTMKQRKSLSILVVAVLLALGIGWRIGRKSIESRGVTQSDGDVAAITVRRPTDADVPDNWATDKSVAFQYHALDDSALEAYFIAILKAEVQRVYRKDWIDSQLGNIYVVKDMKFFDVDAMGTQDRKNIWIAYDPGPENWDPESLLKFTLHFEIGSMLHDQHLTDFPRHDWRACTPFGFMHPIDSVAVVKAGFGSSRIDPKLFDQGFLTEYSKASIQKDFATVHSRMILQAEATDEIGREHGLVGCKIAIWRRLNAEYACVKENVVAPQR